MMQQVMCQKNARRQVDYSTLYQGVNAPSVSLRLKARPGAGGVHHLCQNNISVDVLQCSRRPQSMSAKLKVTNLSNNEKKLEIYYNHDVS
jgi:hypothetical protein